jgi:hypothetical protein
MVGVAQQIDGVSQSLQALSTALVDPAVDVVTDIAVPGLGVGVRLVRLLDEAVQLGKEL